MSRIQSPTPQDAVTEIGGGAIPQSEGFWHSLIDEKEAGKFLGLTHRSMQKYRQTGDGARYIMISKRCLRYRRIDLKTWADARMRSSTSDHGAGER
jgi:hypothetical protein